MPGDQQPLIGDLVGLGKLANAKIPNKLYDDALHKVAADFGDTVAEFSSTGKHVIARLMKGFRDSFDRYMDDVEKSVPPERQRDVAPEIAYPVLKGLATLEPDNPLSSMYIELLKRAIDSAVPESSIHPAFPVILSQLSPSEARILFWAKFEPYVARMSIHQSVGIDENGKNTPKTIRSFQPIDQLENVLEISFTHLRILNLMEWTDPPVGESYGGSRAVLTPTEFGFLFIETCVPNDTREVMQP